MLVYILYIKCPQATPPCNFAAVSVPGEEVALKWFLRPPSRCKTTHDGAVRVGGLRTSSQKEASLLLDISSYDLWCVANFKRWFQYLPPRLPQINCTKRKKSLCDVASPRRAGFSPWGTRGRHSGCRNPIASRVGNPSTATWELGPHVPLGWFSGSSGDKLQSFTTVTCVINADGE